MRIREILDPRRIVTELDGSSKKEILTHLSEVVLATHTGVDHERLIDLLVEREETSTTAIADGIAIPHSKIDQVRDVVCAFGRSRTGLDFSSVDGSPTQLFFLLVSPDDQPSLHLRWLAHLAVLLKNPTFREALLEAETADDIVAVLEAEEAALEERTVVEEH